MKGTLYILIFIIPLIGTSQSYAPRKFYLIDSLNLEELTQMDRQLIDSCLTVYHKAKYDTSKINALHVICENMMHEDWSKYQYFQHEKLEQLVKDKHSKNEEISLLRAYAGSLNNLGFIFNQKGDIKQALNYFSEALKIYEKLGDDYGVAVGLQNLGFIYNNQGEIEKAIETYLKSLSLYEKVKDTSGIANAFLNLGVIHDNQGNSDKALGYYKKSLTLKERIGDMQGVAVSLNNIGYIYHGLKDYKKALEYFNKSLDIYEKLGDKMGIGQSLQNVGFMYRINGEPEKALDYYDKSLKIKEETGDKKGIALTMQNYGRIYNDLGQYSKAEKYATRGLKVSRELGFPMDVRNSAEILSIIYKNQNKGMQALEMYQLFIHMRDSINNEETQKTTLKQQAKYEYEKQKAIDDAENEKLLAIEKEAKVKQQVITYATAGGLALVGIFLIFVFNRLRVTRKQKLVIEAQKQEVEQQKMVVEEAHDLLEEKNKEITDSIRYAKRIQAAILPPEKTIKQYLPNSFIFYQPKDIVAGDFYWMEGIQKEPSLRGTKQSAEENEIASSESLRSHHRNDLVLFAAADCTGHGVPGAMVSVVCNNALNRSVREHGLTDPGEILNKTREIIIEEFEKSDEEVKDGMDIALCKLEIPKDKSQKTKLYYAGANNPLWIIRKDELIEVKADKQPIGKFDSPLPYTTHAMDLKTGDTVYIFTDGYIDQFGGEKGKKFKSASFKELLLTIYNKSMDEQMKVIDDTFRSWKGELEQIDDICIIGVRV